jgi:hypothetical protein
MQEHRGQLNPRITQIKYMSYVSHMSYTTNVTYETNATYTTNATNLLIPTFYADLH